MRFRFDMKVWGFVALALLGALGRLAPHEPNMTPLGAIAVFGGFAFASSGWAAAAVLAALWIPEFWLGGNEPAIAAAVALAFLAPIGLGKALRKRPSVANVVVATLFSSLFFYAVTNAAVWALGDWYERSYAGFIECMAAGVPFWKNMLAGDLCWMGALFGGWALVRALARRRARAPLAAAPAE